MNQLCGGLPFLSRVVQLPVWFQRFFSRLPDYYNLKDPQQGRTSSMTKG